MISLSLSRVAMACAVNFYVPMSFNAKERPDSLEVHRYTIENLPVPII